MNKQIKENDKELEKVNQLLGKTHKEADAKARKEQLLQEKEVLLPQLEQAQKAAENGAKEPDEIQRLMLSIQKEKRIWSVIQIWKICSEKQRRLPCR